MATERLLMRRCREILRLKYENKLTHRAIARACSVGAGTVSDYVRRAAAVGLGWPLPGDLDDAQLKARLFTSSVAAAAGRVLPDWCWVHQELKRTGVTLHLLWEEYGIEHPGGYRYSGFCELYRRWTRKLTPSMRQVHRAGERAFIDYSGKRPFIVNRRTGEHTPVELFVGVLGASSYVYAEATTDQTLASWVGAHIRMLEYFGGCPELFVPDNLKSGITKACRYEPEVNRTYGELARHYGAAVVPARAGKPKDKGKVEVSVLIAQRWILASLRNRVFFSLAELNVAILEKLRLLNERKMQKLGVSRRELFEKLDSPVLKALPVNRYEMSQWKPCTVNIDYHVEVEHNYYSVPHQLIHKTVEARFTHTTVEVLSKGRRVASHARLSGRGRSSTVTEHMPRSHQAHAEWTPSRMIAWSEKTGPAAGRVVAEILKSRPHPEQGYRSCLGILRLGKVHGNERLEAACRRAEQLNSFTYRTIKNILAAGVESLPVEADNAIQPLLPDHENVRGSAYYHKETEC